MQQKFCYPKSFRLLSMNDFRHLKNNGLSVKGENIMAYFCSAVTPLSNTRLGISVSKKFGHAVSRNKAKRHIREFFRTSDFKYLSLDVLIVVFKTLSIKMHRRDLSHIIARDLSRIFRRISEYR